MKRSLISLLAAVILALSMAGGASAGKASLGTPGDPNCVGQSMVFIAQDSHNIGKNGIGNLRKWTAQRDPNHSTDVLAIVQAWCAGEAR